MLEAGRFLSCLVEPVCTTFSPAAHPAVRSYECPLGFDTTIKKVIDGNVIALNCLTILFAAGRLRRPSLLEQPRLSKMAWLRAWRALLELGFVEAVLSSCQFGSIHRKDFRFLGKRHVRIQGKFTKASAMYTQPLAEFLARAFFKALRVAKCREAEDELHLEGHESVLVNDLLCSGNWEVERHWQWLFPAHINVLESNAFVDLLRIKTLQGGSCRTFALLDSRVAKGAHAKGRSSSRAMLTSLRKSAAYQIAGNIYPSLGFSPTRLNVADDPTRSVDLRQSSPHAILDYLKLDDALILHGHALRRPFANWLRLVILAYCCELSAAGTSVYSRFQSTLKLSDSQESVVFGFLGMPSAWISGFWTHGFRGLFLVCWLGWIFAVSLVGCALLCWGCSTRSGLPKRFFLALVLVVACSHGDGAPLRPEGQAESFRAERRATTEILPERSVKPRAKDYREVLLGQFEIWAFEKFGLTLTELVDDKTADPEILGDILVQYGQEMFYAGKPYGRFAETINGIAARRPIAALWTLEPCLLLGP